MKKAISTILAIVLVFAMFTACSQNDPKPTTAPSTASSNVIKSSKDTLTVAVNMDAQGYDPYLSGYSLATLCVTRQIFECLVATDASGKLIPALATEWTWANDGMSINFKLRKGVTFTNGDNFTADDVIWSYSVFRPGTGLKETVFDFAKMQKINDLEVKIPLRNPCGDALYRLCDQGYSIMNKKAVEAAGSKYATQPLGTGPYKFVSWTPGDKTVLVANDKYWGTAPYIKNLIVKVISDQSQAQINLETGAVDLVTSPSNADVKRILDNKVKGLSTGKMYTGNIIMLSFNYSKPWAQDLKVRQAINYAIDKNAISTVTYNGMAAPANQLISKKYSGAYVSEYDSKPVYTYDPQKAKALLAESGFKTGLELVIYTDTDNYNSSNAMLIKKNLEDIGIKVNVQSLATAAYVGDVIGGKKDDMFLGISINGNGMPITYLQYSDPAYTPNWWHAENTGVFSKIYPLYQAAMKSTDAKEIDKIVTQGIKLGLENAINVPLVEAPQTYNYVSTLQGDFYINLRDIQFKSCYFK